MNTKISETNPSIGSALEFRELSTSEIELVSGGHPLAIGAAIGGLSGGAGYLGSAAISSNFSWGGLGSAITVGASIGAFTPVTPIFSYFAPRISYFGGMITSAYDNRS